MKRISILMGGMLLCCQLIMAQPFPLDTIWSDTTLTLANSPHTITNTAFYLQDTVNFTIEAGATVFFDQNSGIILSFNSSRVTIEGTANDSIRLLPAPGNASWEGIRNFNPSQDLVGTVSMKYVSVKGAKYAVEGTSNLIMEDCQVWGGGDVISQNQFYMGDSDISVSRCHFFNNNGVALNEVWATGTSVNNCIIENMSVGMTFFPGGFIPSGPYISKVDFIDLNLGVSGTIEGGGLSDCNFYRNQTAINLADALDVIITRCHFEENGTALKHMGNTYSYTVGAGLCTFKDNDLAVSYYGNGNAAFSLGTAVNNSDFINNLTNIEFFSADTFLLTNNCFSVLDSVSIMNTFVGQNGISPNVVLSPFKIDCIPDLVYPGDTEHNQLCDMSDLFPIGIHLGKTGPTRNNANLNWEPQPATNWNDTLFNGRDIKHVDTDGDGSISLADTAAILQNLGLTHENLRPAGIKSVGVPLYLEVLPGELPPNQTIEVPLYLGTLDSAIADIYGLSFQLGIDMQHIQSLDFIPSASWLGTVGADLISIDKQLSDGIAVGLVRSNQLMASGFGEIGHLQIQFNPSTPDTIKLDFDWFKTQAVDLNMSDIPLSPQANEVALTTAIAFKALQGVSIFPNPNDGAMMIRSDHYLSGELVVRDLQGRTLHQESLTGDQFSISLPELARGIYLLEIRTAAERLVEKLQIIK